MEVNFPGSGDERLWNACFQDTERKKIVGFTVIALSFRVLLPSENAK